MKILIVDDKAENLYLLERIIKKMGYESVSAVSGQDALDKLNNDNFDMIISDILMPVMDGFQLCKTVRTSKKFKDILFIFYTATYTDEEDEKFALNLGADKFLRKPLKPKIFIKNIEDLIRNTVVRSPKPQKLVIKEEKDIFKLYSERLIHKLEHKISELEQESLKLKHLNTVLRTIRNVNQIIVKEKNRDVLIQKICNSLIDTKGYEAAWIALINENNDFVMATEAGIGNDFKLLEELFATGNFSKCFSMATHKSDVLLIEKHYTLCEKCPIYEIHKEDAVMAYRLAYNEIIFGVICVSVPNEMGRTIEEKELVAEFANDIAFALYNLELEKRNKKKEEELKKIEWLLTSKPSLEENYKPPYGDLSSLNKKGKILNLLGHNLLTDIVGDYLDLLETSAAVYERNGDYALGIFTSGWCQFLDHASRNLCGTGDNEQALRCGKWLCHESCWTDASKISIETRQPFDIECNGGIHIYAVPIYANREVIGSINFGYGDPPMEDQELKEIAKKYKVNVKELQKLSESYESRPKFVVEIAKNRLKTSGMLIGALLEKELSHKILKESEKKYREAYNRAELYKDVFAHDINNILQSMLSGLQISEIILENPNKFEELKINVKIMKDQVLRGADLVSNIRKLSQLEAIQQSFKPIDIMNFLENIIELIKHTYRDRDILIQIDSIKGKKFVLANNLLEDVFENILINAIRHNKSANVEIIVKISKEQRTGKKYLKIEFMDNGNGVEDDRKKEIFLRGYSEKRSVLGMGLGLSLVKNIIDSYKGKIWVEDRVKGDYSKGSNFMVLIPEVS